MRPLVVIGDTLLDVDLIGTSERLCPEAPVPVVDLAEEHLRPGGAGLAAMLAARDCDEVVLITALGGDRAGRRLRGLLADHVSLVAMPLSGTTVCKQRVRAGTHPLLRLDCGDGRAADQPLDEQVTRVVRAAGALLVSDYGRGMTAHPPLRRLLAAQAPRIPLVWDPHPRGTAPVPGAALVTPNHTEAGLLLTDDGGMTGDPEPLAARLLRQWKANAVAVTAGAAGALVAAKGHPARRIPVPASAALGPADTCGAGDRFASAAALALRRGSGPTESVAEAVAAATRFVRTGGVATLASPSRAPAPLVEESTDRTESGFALAGRVRRAGGRLVATGGCFDLLHPGHVSLLRHAREQGDALVVCLNSDASVRAGKGPGRPLVSAPDRARVLRELSAVDAVVIFDEATPEAVLERLRPHVWVKGGDYAHTELPEADVVHRHGGQVVLVPAVPGYSTTRLVDSAVNADRALEHI